MAQNKKTGRPKGAFKKIPSKTDREYEQKLLAFIKQQQQKDEQGK